MNENKQETGQKRIKKIVKNAKLNKKMGMK